jgi:hypothetical protein
MCSISFLLVLSSLIESFVLISYVARTVTPIYSVWRAELFTTESITTSVAEMGLRLQVQPHEGVPVGVAAAASVKARALALASRSV